MAKERNAFFNREEQRKRQLGLSPVIMTSVSGFRNIGGYGYNMDTESKFVNRTE